MLLLACSWRIAILDCYCSYCYSCCCYLVFNIFFTLVFFLIATQLYGLPAPTTTANLKCGFLAYVRALLLLLGIVFLSFLYLLIYIVLRLSPT